MTSTQLANVLIKILGLSTCLYGVPSFISGVIAAFLASENPLVTSVRLWTYTIGYGVQLALGILLILMSQKMANLLFTEPDESL